MLPYVLLGGLVILFTASFPGEALAWTEYDLPGYFNETTSVFTGGSESYKMIRQGVEAKKKREVFKKAFDELKKRQSLKASVLMNKLARKADMYPTVDKMTLWEYLYHGILESFLSNKYEILKLFTIIANKGVWVSLKLGYQQFKNQILLKKMVSLSVTGVLSTFFANKRGFFIRIFKFLLKFFGGDGGNGGNGGNGGDIVIVF